MTDREIHEEREREMKEEIKASLVLFVSLLLVDLEYDQVGRRMQKTETTLHLREVRVLEFPWFWSWSAIGGGCRVTQLKEQRFFSERLLDACVPFFDPIYARY